MEGVTGSNEDKLVETVPEESDIVWQPVLIPSYFFTVIQTKAPKVKGTNMFVIIIKIPVDVRRCPHTYTLLLIKATTSGTEAKFSYDRDQIESSKSVIS